MGLNTSAFMAYDLRGRLPDALNEDIAYAVGRALAAFLQPKRVAVGHDIRLSSPALCAAVTRGLTDSGVAVAQIGVCGTEEVYFATAHYGLDGGVMVTASHNPKDYNGLKLVREDARPISADSGLNEIRALVAENRFPPAPDSGGIGKVESLDHSQAYTDLLLSHLDAKNLKRFKVVANPGNGGAGLALDRLRPHLPLDFIEVHYPPDGNFPNGVPNPLLPENRAATAEAVRREGADLGLAWDGDFDRCFVFDEQGRFIEGYYLAGLLAESFLQQSPGGAIVHDPRLIWNIQETVQRHGGKAVESKAGHAFMKETLRREDAIYGGEMSGHHFFRDFAYCDSGMLPWLRLLGLMHARSQPLSALVDAAMARYPVSGELNRPVPDPKALLAKVEAHYAKEAMATHHLDGLSMSFPDWRFNLRPSNTEPLVRLNLETRANPALLQAKTTALLTLIDETALGGRRLRG